MSVLNILYAYVKHALIENLLHSHSGFFSDVACFILFLRNAKVNISNVKSISAMISLVGPLQDIQKCCEAFKRTVNNSQGSHLIIIRLDQTF